MVVAAGRGLRAAAICPSNTGCILGEPVIRPSLAALAAHGDFRRAAGGPPDDAALFQAAVTGLELLPAVPRRRDAASLRACRPRGVGGTAPTSCWCTMRRGRSPRTPDHAGDRGRGHERRGGPGRRRCRHRQDRRCAGSGDRHDRPRAAAHGADAAGLRLCRATRCAHRRAQAAGRDDFTDDAALAEWAGLKVTTFEGEARNVKLTTTDDFTRARGCQACRLERRAHRLRLRRPPVRRRRSRHAGRRAHPHDRGLSGHSDADVVLHALVDADPRRARRRRHRRAFPPPIRNGAAPPPTRFLAFAVDRLRARGGRIAISTSPWSARRRASARTAMPSAPASPRSPACRSSASG